MCRPEAKSLVACWRVCAPKLQYKALLTLARAAAPNERSRSTGQPVTNTPAANGAAVPVWLIVVLFLLLYWGAVYFDQHGGWFDPQVRAPYRPLSWPHIT